MQPGRANPDTALFLHRRYWSTNVDPIGPSEERITQDNTIRLTQDNQVRITQGS